MENIDKSLNSIIIYLYIVALVAVFIFGLVYLAWIRPYF